MGKKKRNPLNPAHTTKSRRDYLDYDYIDQLDDEQVEWLAKFTDEFYGADFKINDTYIREDGKYVQISGNKDKSKNRDLRKYRSVTKYYRNENNQFTKNLEYKYSKENIHQTEEHRKSCNRMANAMSNNIQVNSLQSSGSESIIDIFDKKYNGGDLSPEDIILMNDYLESLKEQDWKKKEIVLLQEFYDIINEEEES